MSLAKKLKTLITILGLSSISTFADSTRFSEGQEWLYKNRIGEDGSKLIINKIENDPKLGKIFHISIFGVKVKNFRIPGGISTDLPHFPVSEETLTKSVLKLIGARKTNSEYINGYNTWKDAFDNGKAGVFTITVAEIIELVESTINK